MIADTLWWIFTGGAIGATIVWLLVKLLLYFDDELCRAFEWLREKVRRIFGLGA